MNDCSYRSAGYEPAWVDDGEQYGIDGRFPRILAPFALHDACARRDAARGRRDVDGMDARRLERMRRVRLERAGPAAAELPQPGCAVAVSPRDREAAGCVPPAASAAFPGRA